MAVANQATNQATKDLYEIGEIPPLGHVPSKMYAWAIRRERHGPPEEAMQLEVVPTWTIADDEVLVLVMAAGVNYNGIWAGLGQPISPHDVHKQDLHIAGSDASGIVWAVGAKVKRWKVGDEVVIHCNQDDGDDEECNGGDPMFSTSQRIWGYETPDGSFAQFCRVQSRQLMERPRHLTWEEAACYTLTLATAYRMLFGHAPHTLTPGDNVLVWGASGGLGVFGVQLCAASGANAIGVISDESKRDYVLGLGAKAVINRKDFNCWGQLPTVNSAGIRHLDEGGAQVRQGDLGHHRQEGRRRRLRASGRADLPRLDAGCQARRHDRVLRGHDGLQPHLRRALCLDAAEAYPGLAFRPSEAGGGSQPVRDRPPDRSLHVRGLPLGEDPPRPHEDVEEPACAWKHGGSGERSANRSAFLRRCARSFPRRVTGSQGAVSQGVLLPARTRRKT
jgi:NADPH:quinone reductase-like Zn-dependent oxidoreductase